MTPSPLQPHILAVVDIPQFEWMFAKTLQDEGYEITICQNRDEISEKLGSAAPHLLILSEKTQISANLDFAADIIHRFPGIPVILILDQDANSILKKALQIGVSDVIVSPVQNEEIKKCIENSLEKARRRTDWVLMESKKANNRLERRLSEMETFSHDLRSPLTAIMGYSELIERVGPVNSLQRDFLQRVVSSTRNIATMVEELLNLSKLEAGVELNFEKVQLSEVINFVVDAFQKHIWDKQIDLVIDVPTQGSSFQGDRVQMIQLVENLLENALKYSQQNGTVHIHSEIIEDQILLQVADTGIGIPASDQKRIFEKFFRGSNVDRGCIGTGLGLSIVQSVVDNHQGRIWVDSSEGKGSTFSVLLPLKINETMDDPSKS
jgi:signal transduction histidine kinase